MEEREAGFSTSSLAFSAPNTVRADRHDGCLKPSSWTAPSRPTITWNGGGRLRSSPFGYFGQNAASQYPACYSRSDPLEPGKK